jgi:hypothetical protein
MRVIWFPYVLLGEELEVAALDIDTKSLDNTRVGEMASIGCYNSTHNQYLQY